MTRSVGIHILACPTCGERFAVPAFGLMNMRGLQRWSDGHIRGDLFVPKVKVSMCTAAHPFLTLQAQVVGFVRDRATRRHSDGWTWWERMGAILFGRGAGTRNVAATADEADVELAVPPPPLRRLDRADLSVLLSRCDDSTDPWLEIELRRELWRCLNSPHRALSGAERELLAAQNDAADNSVFLENLRRLHDLLLAEMPESHPLELGETARALGRFDEAAEWFSRCPPDESSRAQQLLALTLIGRHCPVLLND